MLKCHVYTSVVFTQAVVETLHNTDMEQRKSYFFCSYITSVSLKGTHLSLRGICHQQKPMQEHEKVITGELLNLHQSKTAVGCGNQQNGQSAPSVYVCQVCCNIFKGAGALSNQPITL